MTSSHTAKNSDLAQLDQLTGGAFSAPTAGDRSMRVRAWLQGNPAPEQLGDVFRELSLKDKGAAKLVRERIDEQRRLRAQDTLAAEWTTKGNSLLECVKLNIADAMAWQRDAAKAGAPLSREPLASLKTQLSERVRSIEDLQRRAQVQREAAVLLAQRIEVLSTKSWQVAQASLEALGADVTAWREQAESLQQDSNWGSVDVRFTPLMDASRHQLLAVWDAFNNALGVVIAAAADSAAPLPPVPVWADEVRALRGVALEPLPRATKPVVDPQQRVAAREAVLKVLEVLESEVQEGHGKASAGAAGALRLALKENGRFLDEKLESRAHAALAAAGELEGWQRWRADQLREGLVAQAEGLLQRPAGQAVGGRKMQESLRALREQWKQTDQGGIPNHALWKRFDEACNEAHKVVEQWLDKQRAQAAEHKAQRLVLIRELEQWTTAHSTDTEPNWREQQRDLHQFATRWREAGHMGEKAFAELLPLWRTAMSQASAALEAAQAANLALRQELVQQATLLGSDAELRIDAIKGLQAQWQAAAQKVPLDRRQEQKLWDAFRKPIDDAFQRKTADRERASAALSARDREVLQAVQALEAANASGDAQRIRGAIAALEAAQRGQDASRAATITPSETVANATDTPGNEAALSGPRKVVAARGDDRPGTRKEASPPADRPARSKPGFGSERPTGGRSNMSEQRSNRAVHRELRPGPAAPRLGDAAFRAVRETMEQAQSALRKLAVQAHGEAITQLLSAWARRDPSLLPGVGELGVRATNAFRAACLLALGKEPSNPQAAMEAILRLEIAAEVPTAAENLSARRQLQLQLLTRRHEPGPSMTWGQDLATVLAAPHDAAMEKRVLAALKVLLR